jgi:hypothetical protein
VDVKEVFISLVEQISKMGLEVNEKRQNLWPYTKAYNENAYVKPGTYNFEIVVNCTYLATILTNKNEWRPDTENRITNVNSAYYVHYWGVNQ